MNFKKTLGLVLTAALVSSSLVAVKPAQAATTASATAVVATASNSSTVKSFSYFFAQRSLAFEGDRDSCVVSTAYTGKVQYEMWAKQVSDPNAKWQVVSKGADGKPGYTEAVDGQNSVYTIPLVDAFSYKQGNYIVAVYAKAEGSTGAKDYGLKIGADGFESSTGTEQTCDVATSAKLRVMSSNDKQKYTDVMSGDFMFNPTTLTVNQEVTFTGFDSQKAGAKYKFMVRKSGTDGSDTKNYTFVNSSFESTVKWTPKEAGTYEVIAWSAPDVNKGAARDGWAIGTVTVADSTPVAQQATVSTTISPATLGASVVITSDYPNAAKYQLFDTNGKAITSNSLTALGSSTTVFPAKKTGDQAIVKLFDANGNLLTSVNVTLGTDAKVDKPTPVDPTTVNITATSGTATLGSSVVVTSDFKGATKYQLFDATTQKAITSNSLTVLGSSTTVFPAKKAGDQVIVKLSDANGNVVATKTVTLQ